MKIFRTAFIVPTIIIIALIWIFFAIFFDVFLKQGFIAAGQFIFGAKVEIHSVKTSFAKCSININSIKIGDKKDEFKNLADIDNINFDMRFLPLLSKKVIVDNMSIDGFKWGTKRKTSNKLRRSPTQPKDSFFTKAIDGAKERATAEFNSMPAVQSIGEMRELSKNFSVQSAIDTVGIQSVDKAKTAFEDLNAKYQNYSQEISSIDIQKQLDDIELTTNKISKASVKTAADVEALRANLVTLDSQKKKLEQTYNSLRTLQTDITNDAKAQTSLTKDINAWINDDVNKIAAQFAIPSLDFRDMTRILFGSAWLSKVDSVLYYMTLVRKYMPEKTPEETNKPQAQPRASGRNVIFPLRGVLPSFWIANISITGSTGGEGKDEPNPIDFKGFVKNVTTNQQLIGVPMTMEISGVNAQKQSMKLTGKFNRLDKVAQDTINFEMTGVSGDKLSVPDTDWTPSFNSARVKFNAQFELKGSDFFTKLGVNATNIKYNASEKNLTGESAKYVALLWQGINTANVNSNISITQANGFKMDFSSDIDKQLSARFTAVVSEAVGDVKAKIRDEVTKQVLAQTQKFQAETDKYKQQANSQLEPKLQEVQKQLDSIKALVAQKEDEIKKQALGNAASGLGGLLKK